MKFYEQIVNKKIYIWGHTIEAIRIYYYLKVNGLEIESFVWSYSETLLDVDVINKKNFNFTGNEFVIIASQLADYIPIRDYLNKINLKEFNDFVYYEVFLKKLCIIHGNCHIDIIKRYLESSNEFECNYFIYPTPLIFENQNKKFDNILLKNLDILISQDIQNKNKFGFELSLDYISKLASNNCRIISIPNLFGLGKGFFPQAIQPVTNLNISKDINGMFPDGDECIERCNKQRLEEIYSFYYSKVYSEEDIKSNFNIYMNKIRERDDNLDIKIYRYILINYKKHLIFYDKGHPTNFVLKYISKNILKILNIDDNNINCTVRMDKHQMPLLPYL